MKKLMAITIVLFMTSTASAAITGATLSRAGELAIINCDKEAVWQVYPANYAASYAVSDDGKTLYFASSEKGKVTFFAASVMDGNPIIESHTLYNGIEIPDNEPTPAPEPEPETLESVIKSEAKGKEEAELKALNETLELVISGIERGTITSTKGARETFRRVWIEKGTAVSAETLANLTPLINKISEKVDFTNLDELKEDFGKVIKAISSVLPVKEPAPEPEPETESKPEPEPEPEPKVQIQNCPNGQCPNGQCPNYPQNKRIWIYR